MSTLEQIQQKFKRGVAWNATESIIYQTLLSIHSVVVYQLAGQETFGTYSLVLASIYLLHPLLNLGYDQACASFAAAKNKTEQQFFWTSAYLQLAVQTAAGIALGLVIYVLQLNHIAYFGVQLSAPLLVLACILIISEINRRTLRHLLQYTFHNKITALVEIGAGILYIAGFWTLVYYQGFSLYTLLLPLALQSVISFAILAAFCRKLMSAEDMYLQQPAYQHFLIPQRAQLLLSIICRVPFNQNSILYSIGILYGTSIAASLKLIAIIATMIGTIFEHVFGSPTVALIAHIQQQLLSYKDVSIFIGRNITTIVATIVCFIALNSSYISNLCAQKNFFWPSLFLYLGYLLSENFISLVEKLAYLRQRLDATRYKHLGSTLAWLSTIVIIKMFNNDSFIFFICLFINRFVVAIINGKQIASLYELTQIPRPRVALLIICVLAMTLFMYAGPLITAYIVCK